MLNLVCSRSQKVKKSVTFTDVPERRREFVRSPSQTSENEDLITDQEEEDSEPVESEVTDVMIEESQTELKRIFPVRCALADEISRWLKLS